MWQVAANYGAYLCGQVLSIALSQWRFIQSDFSMEFPIHTEYIELMKLLKAARVVESGGMAKMVIDDGAVLVNGAKELRKRAKLRPGSNVEFNGSTIKITQQ